MIDLASRRVVRRDVGALGPGQHLVVLDSSPGLRSGLYFLRLTQDGHRLTSRVVLIR